MSGDGTSFYSWKERLMTKEQAMQALDEVCAKFQGTRQDHLLLSQALSLVREHFWPTEPKDETD